MKRTPFRNRQLSYNKSWLSDEQGWVCEDGEQCSGDDLTCSSMKGRHHPLPSGLSSFRHRTLYWLLQRMVQVPVRVQAGRQATDGPAQRQSDSKNSFQRSLLVYAILQLIGWGSPSLGRAICFSQSTDSNINLLKQLHCLPLSNSFLGNPGTQSG